MRRLMRMTVAMKQYNLCVARRRGKRGVREGWWRLMCVAQKGQGMREEFGSGGALLGMRRVVAADAMMV